MQEGGEKRNTEALVNHSQEVRHNIYVLLHQNAWLMWTC
jgi:hypothetical protein